MSRDSRCPPVKPRSEEEIELERKCDELSKNSCDDRIYEKLHWLKKNYDRQIFEAKKKKLPWDEQQELERA